MHDDQVRQRFWLPPRHLHRILKFSRSLQPRSSLLRKTSKN